MTLAYSKTGRSMSRYKRLNTSIISAFKPKNNMKTYHFTATITHCAEVEAASEAEARKLIIEEFNDGERLAEITISDEDIELESIDE